MNASAVMVVRDEPTERIARAVASIAAQEGCGPLELVIAAPSSEHARLHGLRSDGTIDAIRLVANPSGARSDGLNRAVRAAAAPFIVRVDARSVLPSDYVARCVRRLAREPSVGVVGGVQRPRARATGARAAGIARALRNPWLLGAAKYRRTGTSGSADTVYLGVFRRGELLATRYDPQLTANEDYDVCARFRRAGQQVWIEAGLEVEYESRDTYRDLWQQYRMFGQAKVRYWRRTRERPGFRQSVAVVGAGAIVAGMATQAGRPRRLVVLTVACVGAVGLVDHLAEPTERRTRFRVHAIAASLCVLGAWVSGVAQETMRASLR